jgi:hypothetical protein
MIIIITPSFFLTLNPYCPPRIIRRASSLGDFHEGDIIDITITRDPESTKAAKVRVSSLIEKLKQKSNN